MASDPLRSQVISFLSRKLCPSGEPAAVAFGQLSRDGRLHVIAHEGFAHFDPSTLSDLHIDSGRAATTALRTSRLTVFNQTEIRPLMTDLPKDLQSYWNSAVAMPIGLHAIYFINFRTDVTLLREFEEFLHFISSLLTSFEWALHGKSGKRVDPWFNEESERLSIREEKILELIRSGLTNAEIAHEIGYSESLIRQETVAIYRKLGVSGRKEIQAQGMNSHGALYL